MRSGAQWLVGAAVTLAATTAQAAGPFDGEWSGANCRESVVTLKVTDNSVVGSMNGGRQVFPIGGKIGPDGKFNGGWITGQFTGTSFKGVYTVQAGVTASDAGRQCLITAERKK